MPYDEAVALAATFEHVHRCRAARPPRFLESARRRCSPYRGGDLHDGQRVQRATGRSTLT